MLFIQGAVGDSFDTLVAVLTKTFNVSPEAIIDAMEQKTRELRERFAGQLPSRAAPCVQHEGQAGSSQPSKELEYDTDEMEDLVCANRGEEVSQSPKPVTRSLRASASEPPFSEVFVELLTLLSLGEEGASE